MVGGLWRSFVTLSQVIEDAAVTDRIDASDALRQFCRHSFELRDWLVGSDVNQSAKDAITAMFGIASKKPSKRVQGTSFALAACADIANESKHYKLTGASYSIGGHAKIISEEMSSITDISEIFRQLVLDVPRFREHQWHWWTRINGNDHDALLLAEQAIDDWTKCLENLGESNRPHGLALFGSRIAQRAVAR